MLKNILQSLLISLILPVLQFYVGTHHGFVSDPLVKAIQVESFKKSGFQSEKIIYNAADWDENASLQPLPDGFIYKNKERLIGVYPIFLTVFYSLFFFIPIHIVPYTNFIFLWGIIYLFKKELNVSVPGLLLLCFGSVLAPQCFDFSENPLFFYLSCVAFIYFYKFLKSGRYIDLIVCSITAGIAIWLRLEILIFISELYLVSFLYFVKEKKYEHTLKIIKSGLIFSIFLIIFFIFNYLDYGNIFGSRYIVVGSVSLSLEQKMKIFLDILFFTIQNGIPTFGFFFYSPIFLFIIILSLIRFNFLEFDKKILCVFLILFSITIGISAPNNGVTLTGRYLSLAVFPLTILFESYYIKENKKLTVKFLLLWSVLFFLFSTFVLKYSYKQAYDYHKYFSNITSKIWVFSSRATSGAISFLYLEKMAITIEKNDDIEKWREIISKAKIEKFSFFDVDEKSMIELKILTPGKDILEISRINGFECNKVDNFKIIVRYECEKNRF